MLCQRLLCVLFGHRWRWDFSGGGYAERTCRRCDTHEFEA